jgi:hypothetical protein
MLIKFSIRCAPVSVKHVDRPLGCDFGVCSLQLWAASLVCVALRTT